MRPKYSELDATAHGSDMAYSLPQFRGFVTAASLQPRPPQRHPQERAGYRFRKEEPGENVAAANRNWGARRPLTLQNLPNSLVLVNHVERQRTVFSKSD